MVTPPTSGRAGIPVDSFGGATVDPTKNVLDLVEAANKRQDDLRMADVMRLKDEIEGVKEHIKEIILAHDKRYEQRYEAQDRAVAKAETAAEKRFEVADKTRLEQAEQQRTLMPRAEAESRLGAMGEKIGVLEGFRTEILSRGVGSKEGWGNAVGVIAAVLAVLSIMSVALMLLRPTG